MCPYPHTLRVVAPLFLGALLGVVFAPDVTAETALQTTHRDFDAVLRASVMDGRVDYPKIAASPEFFAYLAELKRARPGEDAPREERLAFWINAYNALAVKGILDGKSPDSFFGRIGYFKTTSYDVGGEEISLYDLERDVLIPMDEPRIHFAIVCASSSCPKLRSEAYRADALGRQLDESARDFINDPARNRFDRERKVAYLSKIFDWFTEDFEKHAPSLQRYVAPYLEDPGLRQELAEERFTIEFLDYDWSLNGIPPSGGS